MTRDALENHIDPETGELIFDNLPRLPGGEVDWDRLGGEPEEHVHRRRSRDGRRHLINTRPSVPGPGGAPVRPE